MLEYIYYAYKSDVRPLQYRKIKDLKLYEWIVLTILFLPAIMIPISTFFLRNQVMTNLSLLLLVIIGGAISLHLDRDKTKRHEDYAEAYRRRLESLRSVLKKNTFMAYNSNVIRGLIEQCEEQLPLFERTNTIFNPIKTIMSSLIIPLIVIGFGAYLDKSGANEIIYFISGVIGIIGLGLIVYYSVSSTIFGVLNRKYTLVRELKFMLKDILMYDFSDN